MPTHSPRRPLVVTVAEAAELLSCTRAHIYQLIERGALRRNRLPNSRAVRIPYADVLAAAGLDTDQRAS
ncbi:MAG: excisionase family DNA-binding protein [Dehalococcoidia bacterium]|nr:excisionase family DNA-binding protein [Dehalococcoidia bacterium]MCB0983838.1 excisionase family DNA-binding protein [Ilumatobacter sp.]